MKDIILSPIGKIYTPYRSQKDMPIQGCFDTKTEGYCLLDEKYTDGLNDLDGFSHAILIYHFHKAHHITITSKPFMENVEHGIFSIRSPYRPNKIGFSIVKIKEIIKNKLVFTEVDIFNETPLIDIKPYVKYFDNRENVKSGWADKHFTSNTIPKQVILK